MLPSQNIWICVTSSIKAKLGKSDKNKKKSPGTLLITYN